MNGYPVFLFKERPFTPLVLWAAAVNALLFAAFFALVRPAFETNDDTVMMMFSSGMLTGEPSEFLIYINIWVGKLLKALYAAYPAVSWYEILLYGAHFLGMVALLSVFLRLQGNLFGLLLFVVLFIIFELSFLTRIQYTATALVVGFIGVVLFIMSLSDRVSRKLPMIIAAFLLIILATLLRRSAFLGIAVMSAPILAVEFFYNRNIRVPVFALALLAAFAIISVHETYYYGKYCGRPHVLEFEKSVDYLVNGPLKVDRESMKKVNWNRNDLTLFQNWFWVDRKTYFRDDVIALGRKMKSYRNPADSLKLIYYEIIVREKRYLLVGFLCVILAFALMRRDRMIHMVVSIAALASVYVGLSFLSRAPHRGLIPLLFFVCLLGFYFVLEDPAKERMRERSFLCLVILIGLSMVLQAYKVAKSSGVNEAGNRTFELVARELTSDRKDVFVIVGDAFPYESYPLFRNPLAFRPLNVIPTGWPIYTPVYERVLATRSIKDMMKDLLERNDLFVLRGSESFHASLKVFYKDHYGLNVVFATSPRRLGCLEPLRVRTE
jgi:hypothetical protein